MFIKGRLGRSGGIREVTIAVNYLLRDLNASVIDIKRTSKGPYKYTVTFPASLKSEVGSAAQKFGLSVNPVREFYA